MTTEKSLYSLLGLLPSAEAEVIKAAYRALIQRYHPDHFHGDVAEAHKMSSMLNDAYAVLSDPVKRRAYDDSLKGFQTSSGEDIFDGTTPPQYDPLQESWETATQFYTDLIEIDHQLTQISWRLAYSYRAHLLTTKLFSTRHEIKEEMVQEFMQLYFGSNQAVRQLAAFLIRRGLRDAALDLNKALIVVGMPKDASTLVLPILKKHRLYAFHTLFEERWAKISCRIILENDVVVIKKGDEAYVMKDDLAQIENLYKNLSAAFESEEQEISIEAKKSFRQALLVLCFMFALLLLFLGVFQKYN